MNKKTFVLIMCILIVLFTGCQPSNKIEANIDKTPIDQFAMPQKDETIAIIHTTMGDIKVKFFEKVAPKAVENFIKLAEKDYYDGLIFHRVMADFMIQGGDPTGTGRGGDSIYGKPFEDEFSDRLHNFRGALSMANSGANINRSQFFIVQRKEMGEQATQWMQQNNVTSQLQQVYQEKGGTPWLDNKHTVFGQVFEGIEIVDKIAQVEVDKGAKPIEEVKIIDIEVQKY
ncbi:MAG: peptidyl-prolyl cis-trans isomerase (rotamase) - cyclophilin family [Clostridia bacterium]|nr:peptidyl-prolyl cis-trans isomerase (rotamase) - cyclophilin family [Clostridia bacterium]